MQRNSDKADLVEITQISDILREVLANPDKYNIVQLECEKGTSRNEVGTEDHVVQRIGLNMVFMRNDQGT